MRPGLKGGLQMLRLVANNGQCMAGPAENNAPAAQASIEDELRAEAIAIEAWHGKNAYSDFLLRHGQRQGNRWKPATAFNKRRTRGASRDQEAEEGLVGTLRGDPKALRSA